MNQPEPEGSVKAFKYSRNRTLKVRNSIRTSFENKTEKSHYATDLKLCMFNWLHVRSSITGPNKLQHNKLPPGDDSSSRGYHLLDLRQSHCNSTSRSYWENRRESTLRIFLINRKLQQYFMSHACIRSFSPQKWKKKKAESNCCSRLETRLNKYIRCKLSSLLNFLLNKCFCFGVGDV